MNLDDYKQDWKDSHKVLADDHFEKSTDIVGQAMAMEKSMASSDLRESVWAVFTVILIGLLCVIAGLTRTMNLGFALCLLSIIAGALGLFLSRRKDLLPNPDLPLRDFCQAELKRVERRIELLRKSVWIFTLPMMIGACIFMLGIMLITKRGYSRTIRNQYAPIRDELLKTANSLDEPADVKAD